MNYALLYIDEVKLAKYIITTKSQIPAINISIISQYI
jgi:hypothetical protein